jgi:large repetitive protein
MASLVRLVCFLLLGSSTASAGFFTATLGPVTIPDAGPASTYPLVFNVANTTGLVTDVTLSFTGLTHSFSGDVGMMLVSPTGQGTIVIANVASDNPMNAITVTFSDTGITAPFNTPLVSGTSYRPTFYSDDGGNAQSFSAPAPSIPGVNPIPAGMFGVPAFGSFSAFNGFDPNGGWRLFVEDFASQDQGGFTSATLNITTADTSPVPAPPTWLLAPMAAVAVALRRRVSLRR